MNFFVVFGIFAMFAASSWTVDCSPYFHSSGTSTTSTNGGPTMTYTETNDNGDRKGILNGKPVSGREIDDLFNGHGSSSAAMDGLSSNLMNIGNVGPSQSYTEFNQNGQRKAFLNGKPVAPGMNSNMGMGNSGLNNNAMADLSEKMKNLENLFANLFGHKKSN